MNAHIITIGTEILIGQITDTNSAFIGKKLTEIGISVEKISSISDDAIQITETLQQNTSELVIITGGLGPTKDDITKKTLALFFDSELIFHQEIFDHISYLFSTVYKRTMNELNREQAMIPACADVLFNAIGTASGMWIDRNEKIYISLPGVPFEMKKLLTEKVIPRLAQSYHLPFIMQRNILISHIFESQLSELLNDWEDALPTHFSLAYLPNSGRIRLRITAKGTDKNNLENEMQWQLQSLIPQLGTYLQSITDESLEELLGKLLSKNNQTMSIAESCTGGNIAHLLTLHSGSSNYFKGSIVSYATEVKQDILNVSKTTLKQYTVVSEEIAIEMAKGIRTLLKTTFGLSITGVAGPDKGEDGKEIGTFCVGISSEKTNISKTFYFPNIQRRDFIDIASKRAIDYLYFSIVNETV